jgi:hypothetical protein
MIRISASNWTISQLFPARGRSRPFIQEAVEGPHGLRPKSSSRFMSQDAWLRYLNTESPPSARSAAVATRPPNERRFMRVCIRSFSFHDAGSTATFTAGRSYAAPSAPCVRRFPQNWR